MDKRKVKYDALGVMWAFMQMGNYKIGPADILLLKDSCERLRKMLTQKTAGQRKDKPEDVSFDELDVITNSIVLGAMTLYLSGHLDTILPPTPESGTPKPPEAPKKKPIFKMEKMKCPFCEDENKNAEICENVRDKEYFVYCTKCGRETRESFASRAKAIKAFEAGENRDIPKEELK